MVVWKLGHSPDADDAFMFYGLASGKVDTEGLAFDHVLRDIETLNRWAFEGRLEVSAISVHAFAHVRDRYALLSHGASMGEGYGPVVVAREPMEPEALKGKRIAVPGELTSAYLELRLFEPDFEAVVMDFDRVMDEVEAGRVDAGLLIHEGQLTHASRGLSAVLDLGAWWHEETGLPLPLGVNVVRKDLGEEACHKVSRVLKASIVYGLAHREDALAHALGFGRGTPEDLADRFVGMYVNERTVDMGPDGKRAIVELLDRAAACGLAPVLGEVEFVD